jgi:hypothetical protein
VPTVPPCVKEIPLPCPWPGCATRKARPALSCHGEVQINKTESERQLASIERLSTTATNVALGDCWSKRLPRIREKSDCNFQTQSLCAIYFSLSNQEPQHATTSDRLTNDAAEFWRGLFQRGQPSRNCQPATSRTTGAAEAGLPIEIERGQPRALSGFESTLRSLRFGGCFSSLREVLHVVERISLPFGKAINVLGVCSWPLPHLEPDVGWFGEMIPSLDRRSRKPK